MDNLLIALAAIFGFVSLLTIGAAIDTVLHNRQTRKNREYQIKHDYK